MTDRPQPIPDVYRLCDLPMGTKYRFEDGEMDTVDDLITPAYDQWVQVIEWPQRTYNGIPADDLDGLLLRVEQAFFNETPVAQRAKRIREAIAAQDQP
jgi:tRNA A37 threonylcarbamoyladenosine biosynthesis protein TsaE